ncbi:Copia protein, partial [Mucuna pruriens]
MLLVWFANLCMIPRKDTFRQLKGSFSTLSMGIYTNVDCAGLVVDRRSTSGYCMFLGGNVVTWRSKKQIWLLDLVQKQNFKPQHTMKIILNDFKVKYEGPIKFFCDNKLAISIAHNPFQPNRTKHIDIDKHSIKQKLNSGLVATTHVPIGLQVIDIFSKGLPTTRFQELNGKLGMTDIHLPT